MKKDTQKNKSSIESGNALFLILIAVALFAALSYAVTQSGRGGAGIDKERAEILAFQVIQEMGRFQSQIQRLKLIGGYTQVLFNDSPANSSGTCYFGDTATTPCNTVGLFSDDGGLTEPLWTEEMIGGEFPSTIVYLWEHAQVQVGGVDIGTSDPDIYIRFINLAPEICLAYGRRLEGITSAGTLTNITGAGHNITQLRYNIDSTVSTVTFAAARNFSSLGCHIGNSGATHAIYILEEN